jgi:hypothetical protein
MYVGLRPLIADIFLVIKLPLQPNEVIHGEMIPLRAHHVWPRAIILVGRSMTTAVEDVGR